MSQWKMALVVMMVHFFRVLMPQWETTLLPWDLLCSPGRMAWEGDKIDTYDVRTDIATTRKPLLYPHVVDKGSSSPPYQSLQIL